MAEISKSFSGAEGFGRGLERFSFSTTLPSAHAWFKSVNRLPREITADYLNRTAAPLEAIAIIRDSAHLSLLNGKKGSLKIKNTESYMSRLTEMNLEGGVIGSIREEITDDNRTNNYIIPIGCDAGEIQIVINAAWGVQWRLSKDHPLAIEEPKLSISQHSDVSKKKSDLQNGGKSQYIAPNTLSEVTSEIIDPKKLATNVRSLLIKALLVERGKISFNTQSFNDGRFDNSTDSLNIVINNDTVISFQLGRKLGEKRVSIYSDKKSGDLGTSDFENEAIQVADEVNLFYNFTKTD